MSKSSLVTVRLYRNLLRTAKLYTAPSPNAAVLTSLLHRSGIDDHIQDWHTFASEENKSHNNQSDSVGRIDVEQARDLTQSYSTEPPLSSPRYSASQSLPRNNRTYQRLFRRLLREVVTGSNGFGKMIFPSQANTSRLMEVIQREFRADRGVFGGAAASVHFDEATRQKVAFTALRELHKKLSYFDWLSKNSPEPMPNQASWRVSSLPTHPPASYLRPGVFLVSHPYMHDSYFSKSVICILEHKGLGSSSSARKSSSDDDDQQESDQNPAHRRTTAPPGQTYGVIINRVSLKNDTGEHRTLKEVFREHLLPDRMADVFGDSVVREGGPVHVALQMIHSVPAASSVEEDDVGGTVIPFVSKSHDDNNNDPEENPAFYSDRATYFQGNMFKTMSQVEKGKMDRGALRICILEP